MFSEPIVGDFLIVFATFVMLVIIVGFWSTVGFVVMRWLTYFRCMMKSWVFCESLEFGFLENMYISIQTAHLN